MMRRYVYTLQVSCVLGIIIYFVNYNWRKISNAALEPVHSQPAIYFLETTGKSFLSLRQGCSIESASLHNPTVKVTVLTSHQLDTNNTLYRTLSSNLANNVIFNTIQFQLLFDQTPLLNWYRTGDWKKSKYSSVHLSDTARLALLWKQGGLYLDTDVIVLKSFPEEFWEETSLGLQDFNQVNTAVISSKVRSDFLNLCMEMIAMHYAGDVWGAHGPLLLSNLLRRRCRSPLLDDVINDTVTCRGVHVYPRDAFYPVVWMNWEELFSPSYNVSERWRHSYSVHLWNRLTSVNVATPGSGVPIDLAARHNCPMVYKLMNKNGFV